MRSLVNSSSPRLWRGLAAALREVGDLDPVDLSLRLSLLYLLFNPVDGSWWVRLPALLLGGLGLLSRKAAFSPALWFSITAVAAASLQWASDNHRYLHVYWCLAIGIALASSDPGDVLARNGRLLIGLTFSFAVLWKSVLSSDYMDGSFFAATLQFDSRFKDFAHLAGGLMPDMHAHNRFMFDQLLAGALPSNSFVLHQSPQLVRLARFLTWWTICIEGLIGALFLCPRDSRLGRAANAVLLLFTWTTYAIANVPGFAWLLIIMAVAQCTAREAYARLTRALLLASLAVILSYKYVPLTSSLADAVDKQRADWGAAAAQSAAPAQPDGR